MLTTNVPEIIDVNTGEVKTGDNLMVLQSNGIGSCVVVVLFVPMHHVGGIAHVMLPGKAPENKVENRTRYAYNAIEELLRQLHKRKATPNEMIACLVGGGNVLQREDDTICKENLASVEHILIEKGIRVHAKATGGILRRTVLLDIGREIVTFTEGDSNRISLYVKPNTS